MHSTLRLVKAGSAWLTADDCKQDTHHHTEQSTLNNRMVPGASTVLLRNTISTTLALGTDSGGIRQQCRWPLLCMISRLVISHKRNHGTSVSLAVQHRATTALVCQHHSAQQGANRHPHWELDQPPSLHQPRTLPGTAKAVQQVQR